MVTLEQDGVADVEPQLGSNGRFKLFECLTEHRDLIHCERRSQVSAGTACLRKSPECAVDVSALEEKAAISQPAQNAGRGRGGAGVDFIQSPSDPESLG